jgi:hypothetical protein
LEIIRDELFISHLGIAHPYFHHILSCDHGNGNTRIMDYVSIFQVINIINAAQESSPITVVQALDKVLEILRTSELYSPYFAQQMKDNDPMTSDLVSGLVSVSCLVSSLVSVSCLVSRLVSVSCLVSGLVSVSC